MKYIFVTVLLFLMVHIATAQQRSFDFSIFGGAGLATQYNKNVATSGGIDFWWGKAQGGSIGLSLSYNTFSIDYDKETPTIDYVGGYSGVELQHQSSFAFVSPQFVYDLNRRGTLEAYLNVGYGYMISGTETLHKWEKGNNYPLLPVPNYDSTITTTGNIRKSAYRVGTGLMEYAYLKGKWFFSFRQDFGFLITDLSTSADVTNPNRTTNSPNRLAPIYCSFQVGITHHRSARR
jgi:hypothetical protein